MVRSALIPLARALVGLGVAVAVLWGLPQVHLGPDPVWSRIQADGRWRVGMDPSFPPFEFLDAAGNVVGLDVDLARALGATWGVETEIVAIGYDSLVDAVEAHKVDAAISGLAFDPRLTEDVRYSIPYFDAGIRLAVAADATIQGIEDLAGRCVAVEWGSGGDAVARRLLRQMERPTFRVEVFPSPEEALAALRSGQCAGVLMDGVSLRLALAQGEAIRLIDPPLESEPYVIVMSRQAYTLQEQVNQALTRMRVDGVLERLEERHFAAFSR